MLVPAAEAEEAEVERLLLMDGLSSEPRTRSRAKAEERRRARLMDHLPHTSTGNQGQEILSQQIQSHNSQQIQTREKENTVRWCGGSECINPVQVLAVLAEPGPARSHCPH